MTNLERVVIEKKIDGKRLPIRNRTKKGELPWNTRVVAGEKPGTLEVHFPADRVTAIAAERQARLSVSHLIGGKEIGTLGIISLMVGDPVTLKLIQPKHGGIQSMDIALLHKPVTARDLIPAVRPVLT